MSTVTSPILTDSTFSTKMQSLINCFSSYTLTIVATADDSVAVLNQTIRIKEASSGTLFATVVYSAPNTVTVNLPNGFNYLVEPVCTLDKHFCTDKPSGIITSNTTVTLNYKSLGNLATFADVSAALDNGLGQYIPIGTQVTLTHSVYGSIPFDVVEYHSDDDTIEVLAHNILCSKPYDAPEATIYAAEALTAGDYKFKNGSTYYYFTLTAQCPAEGQIRATTSAFEVYSTKTSTVASETGTVSTTEISGATDLGVCGTGCQVMDRVTYGSSSYAECNLDQWLNASGDLNAWYTPQTNFDRPPSYVNEPGFLRGIAASDLAIIADTSVSWYNHTSTPTSQYSTGVKYSTRKFYLASERNVTNAGTDDGSHVFPAYIGAENADRIKRLGTSAQLWWLRTPNSAYYERHVSSSGSVDYHVCSYSYGVVPACQIQKSAAE